MKTRFYKGESLLDLGYERDSFGKPIILTESYKAKLFEKPKKRIQILTPADWDLHENYELFKEITRQGGFIKWANYGTRLGFAEDPLEFVQVIDRLIECFNDQEDYHKSQYMIDQKREFHKWYEREEMTTE